MKAVEYYRGKEQTYLKHLFLEQYLETVSYHIGYSHSEFVFVDCFSGPWRNVDEDLGDTSIRIALDRLNSVHSGLAQQQKFPKIRAIFVEKSPSAFKSLQEMLNQDHGAVETMALPGSFEDNVPRIMDEIGTTFTFFFVDPTGWTGFAMDNLQPILQRVQVEVIINFMYDFINRFLNYESPANEESLDRFFGTRRWREIRQAPNREAAMVELYTEQVRGTGRFSYATSTRIIKPLYDRAYFYLVYATRSPKGVVKFRDVEKKVVIAQEHVRATAQREHREQRTGQTEMGFAADTPSNAFLEEQSRQLQKAEAKLLAVLQQGPILYESLQPLILEIPLVCKTDLNKILAQGQRVGNIVVDGLGPKERVPKRGCTVRLVRRD
jgi:three-Cys-motif partner protein